MGYKRAVTISDYQKDIIRFQTMPKPQIFDNPQWIRTDGDLPKKNNYIVLPRKDGTTSQLLVKEVIGNLVYIYLKDAPMTWDAVEQYVKQDVSTWSIFLDGFTDSLIKQNHSWYSYVDTYTEAINISSNQQTIKQHYLNDEYQYIVKTSDGPEIYSGIYLETVEDYLHDATKTLVKDNRLRWMGLVNRITKQPIYESDITFRNWRTALGGRTDEYRAVFYIIMDATKYNKWRVISNTNWEHVPEKIDIQR